jgi:hypothetical protein
MAKTIEAKAVISAADQTGNTFDKIAGKMKSIEKAAKSFEGIKGPQKFFGNFNEELARLKLSEKELQGVRKSFGELDRVLKSAPIGAANYLRAVDEWKGKTVDHWRQVKASVDEAEVAHKRFFKTAGHFARHTAGHLIGGIGGAYVAGHAVKSVVEAAADRNRAEVRYEQMGLTPAQFGEANVVADSISSRFPSMSRTDVIDDLRKNASRLGSFDRAKEIAETYARARIMNRLSGGDEHELEKTVLTAEGAGAANTTGQLRDFLNGFARARAANPDYTGEEFAKDYRAATAAKYGWDRQFAESDFFTLASHTPGLGVKMATANSALVGNRMTKPSRAALKAAGLIDKNGRLVDEAGFQANLFDWTQAHVKPVLEKQGMHFGENMTVEDKRKASAFATRSFSARNVADVILAALIDAPLVERARRRKTEGLEAADDLQKKDLGLAWEGVTAQIKDLGVAAGNTSFALNSLNSFTAEVAKRVKAIQDKDFVKLLPEDDQRILKWFFPGQREKLQNTVDDANSWLGRHDNQSGVSKAWRMKRFEAEQQLHVADMNENMPPIFTDAEIESMRNAYVPLPMSDPRKALRGSVPLPMEDPRGRSTEMPPVQTLEGANVQVSVAGELSGQAKNSIEITVKPTAWFEASMKRIDSVIEMIGQLRGNGPGETGRSSPDGDAPQRLSTGTPFAGY